MYKVKLERVVAGALSQLRTNIVEGTCLSLPEAGHSFELTAKPLETSSGFRLVVTSTVTELLVDPEADFSFKTQSGSTYRLWIEKPI
jgi:hypothetical protein